MELHRKSVLLAGLLLALTLLALLAAVFFRSRTLTAQQLYDAAVRDAVFIEEDEVMPLVTITAQSDMADVRDGQVLLVTLNACPDRYISGEKVTLPEEVWAVTSRELYGWYPSNKKGVTDWTLRLKQLVGVAPEDVYTHVSAMWVDVDQVCRPACDPDITVSDMPATLAETVSENYREWFNGNILWSYFDSAYPWTRLGYTYDWADNGREYGLSEFWVPPGAEVRVVYTYTVDEFILALEEGRLSSD